MQHHAEQTSLAPVPALTPDATRQPRHRVAGRFRFEAKKMRKATIPFVLLSLALTLLAVPARADNSMAALGAGGIELLRSDHIMLDEQGLFLSSRRIRTRFLFRNEGDGDITTLVSIVIPDIFPESLFKRDDIPLLEALDFSVTVNGRKHQPKADVRAILHGLDVTDQLRELGVRLGDDLSFRSLIPVDLDAKAQTVLKAEGMLHPFFPELPGWDTRLRLYWEQTFPVGVQVEIEHAYTPFLGTENIGPENLDVASVAEAVCLDGERRQRARALLGKPGSQVRNLDYVLSAGSNWKGPIRALVVTIEKQHEADVVTTCLPGLKSRNAMSYDVHMKNVTLPQDIHVLFIESARE